MKAREKEYFKSPDYWELTLGDQKDYIESQVEKYCARNKLTASKLEYACGIASSLQKVFKNKYWFKGIVSGKVSLSLAANEREAVQIAVIPLKDKNLESVKITLSELKNNQGDALPATAVSIYNVCYLKTIANPAYPVPQVREWPDPLVPVRPVDIPHEECRAFWLELRTPKDAKPGLYRGRITVSGKNIQEHKLDLAVKVWPFALPEKQLVETCTWLRAAKTGKTPKARIREYRKYCEFFLDYKINPLGLGKCFYHKNDYSAVLENLEWGIKKGLTRFQIPRLKGQELKNFCNALRRKDLFDKAMIYGYKDEPHPRDYAAFKKDSEEIRQAEPDLKIFMAETPHPGLYGAVDIWWASMAAGNEKYIREQLAAGKQVWWYRCGIPVRLEYYLPHYYYPGGIVIDRPSLDMRIFYTMIWKFKMTPATFFYCGFSQQPAKFDRENMEWEANKWRWSGDGYVVYQLDDEIIPSIRLKCIADGIEDFEYLHILKETLKEVSSNTDVQEAKKLLDIPDTLMIYPYYYNRDPKALLKFREEIGALIAKIRTAN
ncbi:MAG: DUF6067 family protein [Victivallaceae bacterium]|nr:DUF6067 family protein [Victivallaceae bacterium]